MNRSISSSGLPPNNLKVILEAANARVMYVANNYHYYQLSSMFSSC